MVPITLLMVMVIIITLLMVVIPITLFMVVIPITLRMVFMIIAMICCSDKRTPIPPFPTSLLTWPPTVSNSQVYYNLIIVSIII